MASERTRAEVPRVLNVQQFTAAREPELRGLWESLKVLGRLDGSKMLVRHLRRRATSHRRYICKRRPNSLYTSDRLQQQQQDTAAAAAAESDDDTIMQDAHQPTTAAAAAAAAGFGFHRPLNRRQRRRGALLQQLLAEKGCCQDLAAAAAAAGAGAGDDVTAPPRRIETHIWHARRMRMCRRYGHILPAGAVGRGRGSRSFLQLVLHNAPQPKPGSRHHKPTLAAAAASSSSAPGTAAAAAAVRSQPDPVRAACHDASYWCCCELTGQQQQLLALLMHVTDPNGLRNHVLRNQAVMLGQCEVDLVMYQSGKFPLGAIGPVKLMWHRQQQQQRHRGKQQQQQCGEMEAMQEGSGLPSQQQQQQQGQSARAVADGYAAQHQQQQQQHNRRDLKRQQQEQQQRSIWIWCHGSYFKQAHDTLQDLINQHSTAAAAAAAASSAAAAAGTGSSTACKDTDLTGVSIKSLCSTLRRLEVVGPDADYVIRSALQQQQQQQQQLSLAAAATQQPQAASTQISHSEKQPAKSTVRNRVWQDLSQVPLRSWTSLPERCVLGFWALDPRLARPLRYSGSTTGTAAASAAAAGSSDEGDCSAAAAAAAASLKNIIGGWPSNGRLWVSTARQLLQRPSSVTPAAPEVLISMWRQQQQQAALGLTPAWQQQAVATGCTAATSSSSSSSNNTVICYLERARISPYGITSRIAAASSSSSEASGVTTAEIPVSCPVLLFRSNIAAAAARRGSSAGWSVILPAGWVMPFWLAITHAGAKPAGLREWSWLAAATHTPLPPVDYPDTAAAAAAAQQQHQEVAAAAARRPLGRMNMRDCWLPYLDWSRLGQQLRLGSTTAAAAAAAAAGSSLSGPETAAANVGTCSSSNSATVRVPHASVCWAAAKQLQATAMAGKRQQRKHRQLLRKQELRKQQQQQQQMEHDHGATAECQQLDTGASTRRRPVDLRQQHCFDNIQQQQQQQQQQQHQQGSLLPSGWYVGHSWEVILAALPATAVAGDKPSAAAAGDKPSEPADGDKTSAAAAAAWNKTSAATAAAGDKLSAAAAAAGDKLSAAAAAAGVKPSATAGAKPSATAGAKPSAAAAAAGDKTSATAAVPQGGFADGHHRNRSLARAVHQGLLAWAPKVACTLKRSNPIDSVSQQSRETLTRATAMTPAAATAGDETSGAAAKAHMDIGWPCIQKKAGQALITPPTQLLSFQQDVEQVIVQQPPRRCLVRVAIRVLGKGRCQQGALLISKPQEHNIPNNNPSTREVILLGYVTTAAPRGAPASLYPGGLGFCSVEALWGLRCQDVTPRSSRVLRAWCLNPGSDAVRSVELTVLLRD